MIRYATGNLLEAGADALVNTVNTVGVMGKGIALMFKEAFPDNFRAYVAACKRSEVRTGRMFVTRYDDMYGGPKWIINFPTKRHWRHPSRMEWISEGLVDLKAVIAREGIRSVALPPLGVGNGGLHWPEVRALIEETFGAMPDVEAVVYEPTAAYQNVSKRAGIEALTPARALIAEMVRRYWVLGFECSLLEVQKLAWFLETRTEDLGLANPLGLRFEAHRYGPYADRLRHLLEGMDGSYLHCGKRLADAKALDTIWFDDAKRDRVDAYLRSGEAKVYRPALEATARTVDGFESPLGLELLATVDWLLRRERVEPTVSAVRQGIRAWPGGKAAAQRKDRILDDRLVELALARLDEVNDRRAAVTSPND